MTARGRLASGIVTVMGTAAVAWALRRAGIPWADVLALLAFLIVLPVASLAQVRALRNVAIERMPAYVGSIVSLLGIGLAAFLVGGRDGGAPALGLVPMGWGAFAAWTAAVVGAGLAATALFRWVGLAVGVGEEPILRALLPVTTRERVVFVGLSGAAGVGEELAYRGYVIPVLAGAIGTGPSAVVSSLVFGVLHVYQGPLGIARTAVLGGLLAWVFIASGSLWPAVAGHAVLDVVLGIFLADRMMVPEEPDGVLSREPH